MAKQGKRRGRQFWSPLVERFEASGESALVFARRHRVNAGTLRGWVYQLRREKRDGADPMRFVEVQAAEIRRAPVEVAYGERTVVRLPGDATADDIAKLVLALETARSC